MRGKAKQVDVMTLNVLNMKQTVERARASGNNISEYTLRRAIKEGKLPCKILGKTYMIAWDNFLNWVNCDQ